MTSTPSHGDGHGHGHGQPAPGADTPAWTAAIPSMLRTAHRVLGSHDLAHDAVQDALLHAWTRGRLEESPHAALCCLSHLSSLEIRRSRGRAQRRDALAAAARDAEEHASDPSRTVETHDCARHVRTLIAALPADCGEPLWRFLVDGQSYDAIATALEVPIGTVRSRIARARRLLRAELEASGYDIVDGRLAG